MAFVIVLVILVLVVFVVTAPLRRAALLGPKPRGRADRAGNEIGVSGLGQADAAELEAARAAKYREIRDAELDHRTGKLSDEDYEAVDRALRAEAIEILRALDRAGGGEEAPG